MRATARLREQLALILALGVYEAVIVRVSMHHEMWRDEVRALSLALEGPTISSMLAGLRDEGHPFIWYLLLRLAHTIAHTPLVLPVSSILVATTAAWIFLRYAPFPFPWRVLFLFGSLPLFEYSVMCRNYGIGMLLLFLICASYAHRWSRPWLHGLLLFLLANTSAHAAILAGALLAAWIVETPITRAAATGTSAPAGPRIAGISLAVLGIALCAYQTFPSRAVAVTGIRQADLGTIVHAAVTSVIRPGAVLHDLVLGGMPPSLIGLDRPAGQVLVETVTTALLVLVGFRLRRHRDLLIAFILATLGFGLFFRLVYVGYLRHVGLLLLLILALEWIARTREGHETRADHVRRVLAVALPSVLAIHAIQGARIAWRDDHHALSSSKAFAGMVRSVPEYRDAIIVGEPDYTVESLPYYLGNRLFSVEQDTFERWVRFTRGSRDTLSLGRVLDRCEALARDQHSIVLLALAHREVLRDSAGTIPYRYGAHFTWTPEQRARLVSETRPLEGFFRADGDENYFVFQIPP